MAKIQLKVSPSLIKKTDVNLRSGWLVLDREIGGGTTISDFLSDLATDFHYFSQLFFDPATGEVSDDVNVVLNDFLLLSSEAGKMKLREGDRIVLVPVYTGG
ncbi:MAG: MoaD/ThiS family protein [Chloroflexota bacterium]